MDQDKHSSVAAPAVQAHPRPAHEGQAREGSASKGVARFFVGTVAFAGVLAAGLIGGFTAAKQQSDGSAAGGHGHGHGGGEQEHPHGGGAPTLSERALANLGVEVGSIALDTFVRSQDVPAVVEALPLAARPVTSPVSGRVRSVKVAPGRMVKAGEVIAEVVRDAFPAIALSITESVLKPLNEDYHRAAADVRTAALALSLTRAERERLSPAGSAPTEGVIGRVLRDAVYAEQRAEQQLANAREEAERHGMTPEQTASLEKGAGGEIPGQPDVRRVLQHNRLWSAQADAALALLPAEVATLPHTLAVLGELVGAGRLTPELARALKEEPRLAAAFLDAAGLVQAGATPEALSELAAQGAFDAVVVLKAPADGPPAWDVLDLDVRAGSRVEAGDRAAHLRDDRVMALRLTPAPSDLGALAKALASEEALKAEPLVRGAGPALEGIRLVALSEGAGTEGGGALAQVANRVLAERRMDHEGGDGEGADEGGAARTWELRPGLTYAVRVPVEKLEKRFVLPADAIAYKGPEAVVLLPDGSGFRAVPVRLEHHDARVAVVAADGALFPGDLVVLKGAPALALAILAGAGGGADPHAGHSH